MAINARLVAAVFLILLVSDCVLAQNSKSSTRSKTRTTKSRSRSRTPSLVPIGPSPVPTNPAIVVVTFRVTGVVTLPVTSVVVDRLLTSLATTAQVARSAVQLANAQIVQVSNANIVQIQAFITASSAVEAGNVATRINTDVQDGNLGTGASQIAVSGVQTVVTHPPPSAVAPGAPAAPTSSANRVKVRFSVIITGIDLSGFSADSAAFRTSVSNYLKLGNADYVTIIDRDLITYAKKFTTADVGVRVIFEASMPDQASANNALAALKAEVAANGNKIGTYEVRDLQTTTSSGDSAVWVRPAGFLVALVALLAAML